MKRITCLLIALAIAFSTYFINAAKVSADEIEEISIGVIELNDYENSKDINDVDVNQNDELVNEEETVESIETDDLAVVYTDDMAEITDESDEITATDTPISSTDDIIEYDLSTDEGIMLLSLINSQIGSSVVCGESHVIRLYDGKVQTMGNNDKGQLGTGDNISSDTFVDVVSAWGDKSIVQVETRGNTSYALTSDGELYAWGDNSRGQFGNSTTTDSNLPVRAAGGMTNITKISAGLEHAAISCRGFLYVFGDNTYG